MAGSHHSHEKDSPIVEDSQLLRTERQGCCKKKEEPPPKEKCCGKKSSQVEVTATVHEVAKGCCGKKDDVKDNDDSSEREESPHVSCFHHLKGSSESQEQIM